jgi:hypothetical protein
MSHTSTPGTGEALSNLVENLACRVASERGGRVFPAQILPYAPVSLALVTQCLDEMADGAEVLHDDEDGMHCYLLTAYAEPAANGGPPGEPSCASCGVLVASEAPGALCADCGPRVGAELARLAETTGWPAQAVYEHEIMYLAANHSGPVRAEDLAGRSRHTLRSMRRKLRRLTVEGYIRQDLDEQSGLLTYRFPELTYERSHYGENMRRIRAYPASLQEEIELRVVRICLALGALLLAAFVLALMRVPLPLLAVAVLVAAPLVAIYIWTRRTAPPED